MKQILTVLLFAGLAATSSCSNSAAEREKQAQQRALDSMKMELANQKRMDSMREVVRLQQQAIDSINDARQREAVAARSVSRRSAPSRSYSSASTQYTGAGQVAPVQQQQKKGWSAKAKGAVIGAGVGAVTGAIVNDRNRAAGAVIGGVTGAAAGTGVGAIIDKKKGR